MLELATKKRRAFTAGLNFASCLPPPPGLEVDDKETVTPAVLQDDPPVHNPASQRPALPPLARAPEVFHMDSEEVINSEDGDSYGEEDFWNVDARDEDYFGGDGPSSCPAALRTPTDEELNDALERREKWIEEQPLGIAGASAF